MVGRLGDPADSLADPENEIEERRSQADHAFDAAAHGLLARCQVLGHGPERTGCLQFSAVATAAEKERFAAGAGYSCPACDAELFPWSAARHPVDRSMIVVDRCEVCRLSVTRGSAPPDVSAELVAFEAGREDGRVSYRMPNQLSFQGGLGGAQWAGLEPDRRRLHPNPDAIRRLLGRLGAEAESVDTRFGWRGMWQTLVNAFTLRDNFLPSARAGRLPTATGKQKFEYAIDTVVTVLVAIPVALAATVLEAVAALFGRGGEMFVSTRERAG